MRLWPLVTGLLLASAGWAEVELTPRVGYRSGGFDVTTDIVCIQAPIQPPCPTFAESEDDLLYGLVLDVPVRRNLQLELLVDHQPTSLVFRDFLGVGPASYPRADLDITHVHAGVLRSWRPSSVEPFVVLGAGRSWLRSDPVVPGVRVDWQRPSASLGAGAKIGLGSSDRLALRLEARGYWVDLPRADYRGPLLPLEGVRRLSSDLRQLEATTGLSIKF